jgi:2',3'-cyclic-nucleotide 2'-phosphodiesterase/3'-nucleotidase
MPILLDRRAFLATTAGFIAMHPFSLRAQAGQAHLRIMETTDIHVHVFPYDYYGDRPVDTVGLARTASLVGGIRAESTNSMLLDNGDFLQGNPMGDYMAYERGMSEGDVHPMIAAMNTLGFDASTLGNHEFNYGLPFLMNSVAGAAFPVVCANVSTAMGGSATGDTTLVPPYVMLDKTLTDGAGESHPIRIGIIGFVPPQIMTWDRRHLEGNVQVRDIVAAAQAYVPQMREEGAEIVIALSHSGIGEADHSDMMENASVPLAGVDGIDVVLTGHHHRVFPGPDYAETDGRRRGGGHDHGQARPSWPASGAATWALIDLMLERDGNTGGGSPRTCPRRGRSTGGKRTARSPRWWKATRRFWPRSRPSMRRRSPMSAPRWGKRMRRCIPTSRWWPTIRPSRSCRTRRPGTSLR